MMKLRRGKLVKRDFARATSVSVERFYARRGKTGKWGDSIKTNTLLYQELEVLANYVVYRMPSKEKKLYTKRSEKAKSCLFIGAIEK